MEEKNILWNAYPPENILSKLSSSQLAESLRTWYIFRENFAKKEFNTVFSAIGSCQCIWFNRSICSKSKQYFLYEDWLEKGIVYISDLLNPPHPGYKLFEELILDYDISKNDRRKYNFLVKNIPEDWFVSSDLTPDRIFEAIKTKLLKTQKNPKYAYNLMREICYPERQIVFWNVLQESDEINWEKTHVNNFLCTISTRIRSFYFKLFHRAIGLNDFLYKIKRKDSPNCSFCNNAPETYVHLFVQCPSVQPIWEETLKAITQKSKKPLNVSIFEQMFGFDSDKFLTYLFLLLKYYVYICKFQNKPPSFKGYKAYVTANKELEYSIAKRNNRLSTHFRKWRFEL